jgi:hypothetical protein
VASVTACKAVGLGAKAASRLGTYFFFANGEWGRRRRGPGAGPGALHPHLPPVPPRRLAGREAGSGKGRAPYRPFHLYCRFIEFIAIAITNAQCTALENLKKRRPGQQARRKIASPVPATIWAWAWPRRSLLLMAVESGPFRAGVVSCEPPPPLPPEGSRLAVKYANGVGCLSTEAPVFTSDHPHMPREKLCWISC